MTTYNEKYTYEILENGYRIYYNGGQIEQTGEYAKPMDSTKTYEENCLLQLAELSVEVEPQPDLATQVAENAANIDYLATMADIEL